MILLLCGASCGGDPCVRYQTNAVIEAHCRVRYAAEADSVAAARCERTGDLEEDCRKSWVVGHLDRPMDELLAACATDECRFFALDWSPLPFREQVGYCTRSLSEYVDQCVGHAAIRYLATHPPVDEQRKSFAGLGAWNAVVAMNLGAAIRCGVFSDCAILESYQTECKTARRQAPVPEACLSLRPEFPRPPPFPGGGPTDVAAGAPQPVTPP